MLRNVTARVRVEGDDGWGTAWFVNERLALTAAHCVGPVQENQAVTVELGDRSLTAVVKWKNSELDAALLQVGEKLPIAPAQLARVAPQQTGLKIGWSAFGYPSAYPEGLTITGLLTSTDGRQRGLRLIELACYQGVDSTALNGMSGAALCVNSNAVGIIVSAPPRLSQRVVFAVPLEAIAASAIDSGRIEPDDAKALSRLVTLELDDFDRSFSQYLATIRSVSSRLPQGAAMQVGPSKRPKRSLDDVFVPLTLRLVSMDGEQADAAAVQDLCGLDDSACPTMDLAEGIRSAQNSPEPNIFFFGDPGSGKSSVLRHIASRAWEDSNAVGLPCRHIPMLIRLGNLVDSQGGIEDWLWDGMCRGSDTKPESRPPAGYMRVWSERTGAPWLLLLDGFDEVPARSRNGMLDSIGGLLDSGEYLCFVTSRPAQGKTDKVWLLCNTSTVYELLPLSGSQESVLIEKWLGGGALGFRDQFSNMRFTASKKTPLLVAMAASVYQMSGRLPQSRVELYEHWVQASLDEAAQKGLSRELDDRLVALARHVLEYLAYFTTETQQCSTAAIVRHCAAYLKTALGFSAEEAQVRARETVRTLGRLSGLLYCDDRECAWLHNTIREYLAACYFARTTTLHSTKDFVSKWHDEAWSEVVLFWFAILPHHEEYLENPQDLTEELANKILSDAWPEQALASLFVCAAWAEGAAIRSPLSDDLVEYLRSSSVLGGGKSVCRQVYADLASNGRSPIDLLGRLAVRTRSAGDALLELIGDRNLQHWARESACLAAIRAGMSDDLRRLYSEKRVSNKLARLLAARIPNLTSDSQAQIASGPSA